MAAQQLSGLGDVVTVLLYFAAANYENKLESVWVDIDSSMEDNIKLLQEKFY